MKAKKILIPLLAVSLFTVTSCSRDNDDTPSSNNSNNNAQTKEVTLDTTDKTKWKYFSFETGTEVTVTDPKTSLEWDIAFTSYYVKLNGGESGSGQGEAINTNSKDYASVNQAPTTGYTKDIKGTMQIGYPPTSQEGTYSSIISGGFGSTTGYLNISPSNQGVWPSVYAPNQWVYILKTAKGKFVKFQVNHYYNDRGKAGYPKFKYQVSSDGKFQSLFVVILIL